MMDTILKTILVPIHPEGRPFIIIFALVSFLMGFALDTLGWLGMIMTVWCVYFFRDPVRIVPNREALVISPADGVVQQIGEAVPPAEMGIGQTPRTRISIFMNVFDCHVNRSPVAGTITDMHYYPGLFLNATLDKASEDNERQALRITTADGKDFVMVQIAGLIARRIVCDVNPDQKVQAGERVGMIRFGSRVDIYLPEGLQPLVIEGQKAVAGETILADMLSTEARRVGTAI